MTFEITSAFQNLAQKDPFVKPLRQKNLPLHHFSGGGSTNSCLFHARIKGFSTGSERAATAQTSASSLSGDLAQFKGE